MAADITHRIPIDITFKQSENNTKTHTINFLILKDSATLMTFGKPTLDWLGFKSTRTKIWLEHDDIRFNTVVSKGTHEELYLTSTHPCEFIPEPSRSTLETVITDVPHKLWKSKKPYWISPSRTTPQGLEVIEGPLVRLKDDPTKAILQVICNETSSCETTAPLASLRPMTEEDAETCDRVSKLEEEAREHAKWKKEQLEVAEKEAEDHVPVYKHIENFRVECELSLIHI